MNPAVPPIRPLTVYGRSYELLDIAAKPVGRYLTLQQVLDAIREWPRRTVFVVRLWTDRGGAPRIEKQWLMHIDLNGTYRARQTRKHWTMRSHTG